MASFNRVTLIGNLTRDPQLKQLPNGQTTVVEFGLAASRRYRSATGEDKEEACFVDCAAFGKQADVIAQWCTKGKPLFVEGRLKFDSWDDKGGGKRSKLSVVVENFQFLGGRDNAGDAAGVFGHNADDRPHHRQASSSTPNGERKWRSPQQRLFPAKRSEDGEGVGAGNADRSNHKPEQPFGDERQFKEADIPF